MPQINQSTHPPNPQYLRQSQADVPQNLLSATLAPITVRNKASGAFSEGAGSTWTTASITTVTGRLYLFTIRTANDDIISISTSNGVTFGKITSQANRHLYAGVCAAGGTGTWTITTNLAGDTGGYVIDEAEGAAYVNPIVQSGTANVTVSPLTVTLAAFADPSNAAYLVTRGGSATTDQVKETGWTDVLAISTFESPTRDWLSGYIKTNDATPSATFSTPNSLIGIAVEIRNALAQVNAPFNYTAWPVPPAAVRRQPDPIPNLIGRTLPPTGADPFRQNEQPNPVLRVPIRYSDPPNLIGRTLPPTGADPFRLADWTTPGRQPRQGLPDQASLLATLLAPAPEAMPFRLADWATPGWQRTVVAFPFQNSVLPLQFVLEATVAPAVETFSGGWHPRYLPPRLRQREQTDEDIKAERVRMGIIPPEIKHRSSKQALEISRHESDSAGATRSSDQVNLAAHLLPEDLAGLEALAARAAQLTIDHEIALWLRLAQQRRLHDEWLRDEDDAAVLMLAIATLH